VKLVATDSITPLESTLTGFSLGADSKGLSVSLSPLYATLTKIMSGAKAHLNLIGNRRSQAEFAPASQVLGAGVLKGF